MRFGGDWTPQSSSDKVIGYLGLVPNHQGFSNVPPGHGEEGRMEAPATCDFFWVIFGGYPPQDEQKKP